MRTATSLRTSVNACRPKSITQRTLHTNSRQSFNRTPHNLCKAAAALGIASISLFKETKEDNLLKDRQAKCVILGASTAQAKQMSHDQCLALQLYHKEGLTAELALKLPGIVRYHVTLVGHLLRLGCTAEDSVKVIQLLRDKFIFNVFNEAYSDIHLDILFNKYFTRDHQDKPRLRAEYNSSNLHQEQTQVSTPPRIQSP